MNHPHRRNGNDHDNRPETGHRARGRCDDCENPPRYRFRYAGGAVEHLCASCATTRVQDASRVKIGAEAGGYRAAPRPALHRMERTQRNLFDDGAGL